MLYIDLVQYRMTFPYCFAFVPLMERALVVTFDDTHPSILLDFFELPPSGISFLLRDAIVTFVRMRMMD